MSVSNGQSANQTTFNNAFVSKTVNSTTIGQVSLNNADGSSGSAVTNIQRELNSLASFLGKATNQTFNALPAWTNSTTGASSDDVFDRADALTVKIETHTHSGAAGQGAQINLATSVQGILPGANLGTFASGQIFFAASGELSQASGLFWDGALNLNTISSIAASGVTINGGILSTAPVSMTVTNDVSTTGTSATLPLPVTGITRLSNGSLASLAMIEEAAASQLLVLWNTVGATVSVLNETGATATQRIVTGTGDNIQLAEGASLFLFYSTDTDRWYVIGGTGGGGGGTVVSDNFTGSVITLTADTSQKWRGSASAAISTGFDISALTDDEYIEVLGTSDTNTVTIAIGASGVEVQNGEWVGYRGSVIAYRNDATLGGLVEVFRNGI